MNKKTVRNCLILIAVCLLVSGVYVLMNRSTSREATAGEIEAQAAYLVDWTAVPGWQEGMGEKEFILTLCDYVEDQTIGSNVHQVYSSETLGDYLYRCHELTEITVMNGSLYITYYAEDEDMVILAYNDGGLFERAIYDAQTDTLFHERDGSAVVWNKFRSGFQFGS